MVMLCFVLDLRTIPPPILKDLKQSLMMLGNYCALSLSKCDYISGTTESKPLLDLIGLHYIYTDMSTYYDEVKAAYSPQGDFDLHDFHFALNTLPADNFSPDFNEFDALFCEELKLAEVIDEVVLSSSKSLERAAKLKLIVMSSCLVETLDQTTRDAILDVTDKHVSLEFVFLERKSSLFGDVTVNRNNVVKQIGDLRNCQFFICTPDLHVRSGLAKRWFQELKVEKEEQLQARFVFKINLLGSLNQLSCNLLTFFNPIIDGFNFYKTCRCHGIPLGHSKLKLSPMSCRCPVTNDNLQTSDMWEKTVEIGEQTTLYMPSFYSSEKLQKRKISSPINFNVIQRTDLGSLSEGIIIGTTHAVAPSTFPHTDDMDTSNLNNQVFQAVCGVLNSFDQGLVCSSNCNLETLTETSFKCYYILLPSEKGLMVLRRLLASEEFLPIPDASRLIHCDGYKETETIVQESLLKIEKNKYDPVQHERGFHQEMNSLVKHSLRVRFDYGRAKAPRRVAESPEAKSNPQGNTTGSSKRVEESSEAKSNPQGNTTGSSKRVEESSEAKSNPQGNTTGFSKRVEESSEAKSKLQRNTTGRSKGEWVELVVEELPDSDVFPCSSNSERDQLNISSQNSKKLDEKTSSILERLEIPREIKRKAVEFTTPSSTIADERPQAKRPLIPFEPSNATAVPGPAAGQLIRPNFQRTRKG
ncbi:uncharacterized protein [Henckelia pumila]|uniref:uncharacterized protein n=1 Tax=Henckelia pumila TaxID=405737 RepID=UPI003C6E5DD4